MIISFKTVQLLKDWNKSEIDQFVTAHDMLNLKPNIPHEIIYRTYIQNPVSEKKTYKNRERNMLTK